MKLNNISKDKPSITLECHLSFRTETLNKNYMHMKNNSSMTVFSPQITGLPKLTLIGKFDFTSKVPCKGLLNSIPRLSSLGGVPVKDPNKLDIFSNVAPEMDLLNPNKRKKKKKVREEGDQRATNHPQ